MNGQSTFAKTLTVIGTLVGLYVLFQMRYLVLLFFSAILFGSTVRPVVTFLEKWRVRRTFAILLIYLVTFVLVTAAVVSLLPTIVTRFVELSNSQGQILQTAVNLLKQISAIAAAQANITVTVPSDAELNSAIEQVRKQVEDQVLGSWSFSVQLLTDLLLVFTMAFYWLTERDRIQALMMRLVPLGQRERVESIFNDIESALGAYVRGQGLMILTVGAMVLLGLSLLGVPYALLLAALAGIAEAIPIVGPILGAVPGLLVTAITAPERVVFVLLMYVIIQQIESAVLVPKIMERQVGLSPLLVILALAAGNLLAGLTGALIAVPIAAAL
ncbi:MAG: AI-2E family transporter, partial [Chloroflexi bacterium]|nr:AI-2E family transporter [Chloroflexota bacterium]